MGFSDARIDLGKERRLKCAGPGFAEDLDFRDEGDVEFGFDLFDGETG